MRRKGGEIRDMYKRNIFGRLAQSAAAVTAAVCAAVMTTVGYYSAALPDSYTCAYGSEITANTVLPITAQELAESRAAFKSVSAGGAGRSSKNVSLRLFGSVPIKDVKEETVDRPTLAVGGSAFGIRLVTDGVMIIDMKSVSGKCPAKDAGLKIGDVIEAVNGERVSTNDRVSEIIKSSGGKKCTVRYRRGGKKHEVSVKPVLSEGSYRAGMWVRDSSAGIGTMTFFDPETLAFAGLGHAICDSDTHEPLPLSEGSISDVKVNGCKKSEKGEPGQLVGEFTGGETGSLSANCDGGVYGALYSLPQEYTAYPLAFSGEVHEGAAVILSQTDGGEPQQYDIVIEKLGAGCDGHDMVIRVTDEALISKTGGIVQGMSGSPIIQDGRLAGAVTHVFIDDPEGGYGIFAEKMYDYACAAVKEQQLAG